MEISPTGIAIWATIILAFFVVSVVQTIKLEQLKRDHEHLGCPPATRGHGHQSKPHAATAQEAESVIQLAGFVYQFCQVKRATYLPDGTTPETDADHTIMLLMQALVLAPRYRPQLDLGLVLQLILIHDIEETYAGDTPTLQIDEAGRKTKEQREARARQRIKAEFGSVFPYLVGLLELYARQDTPEARFVKMLDKLMPNLSHVLNGGVTLHQAGITLEEYQVGTKERTQFYLSTSYGADNPELLSLRDALRPFLEKAVYGTTCPS